MSFENSEIIPNRPPKHVITSTIHVITSSNLFKITEITESEIEKNVTKIYANSSNTRNYNTKMS